MKQPQPIAAMMTRAANASPGTRPSSIPSGRAQTPACRNALRLAADFAAFRRRFSVENQAKLDGNEERCFCRPNLPTLKGVADAYGRGNAAQWVYCHLVNAVEMSGAKKSDDLAFKMKDYARILLAEAKDLNPSEMMLFFRQFKGGLYGRFYGTTDLYVVGEGLRKFREYRAVMQAKVTRRREEAERRRAEAASAAEERISYDEYKRRLRAAENAKTTKTPP